MKLRFLIIVTTLIVSKLFSQDITFIPRQTSISDTMGKELIFYIDVRNISSSPQTLFIVRTQNNLPSGWSSSLCLDFCYPPFIDSVATTPDFGSNPLQPGEMREVSLHVYTSSNTPGQGTVQLKAGTFRNPTQTIIRNFTANTYNPTSVEDEYLIKDFNLEQNYPNPFGKTLNSFNPSTTINWKLSKAGWISIKLYNSLGQEVDTIVEGYYESGNHSKLYLINSTLPAGIYFYQLRTDYNVETKKMILEK
ncbi:MAG: T9SS type A sorting domain-containing protein [Ignavibacterium sp.]|nr:T9SS type A sorting domain-containing protein [Ignavibacterium sp.]MDW8375029.1 T9SS type A sorting domain-containing protein [Ignavibacteriales bacterium]